MRVIEEIKNTVGTCGFASPPEVDLRLGITADDRYVFVIREAVQCALLNLKTQANKALEGKASQDLAQKLGIGSLATECGRLCKRLCAIWRSARSRAQLAPLALTSLGSMQRCVACAQTWRS